MQIDMVIMKAKNSEKLWSLKTFRLVVKNAGNHIVIHIYVRLLPTSMVVDCTGDYLVGSGEPAEVQ